MLTDEYVNLIDEYAQGPRLIEAAVEGMTAEELDARPIPGKWSTRQVIVHLADFEFVNADRMKRVLTQDRPTLLAGDPDAFAERLAYGDRDLDEELQLIRLVRAQMVRILSTLSVEDFLREGVHTDDGPLTLAEVLRRVTIHIPHHLPFISAKRQALRAE